MKEEIKVLYDTTGWSENRPYNRGSKYDYLFVDYFDAMAERLVNCSVDRSEDVILVSTKKQPTTDSAISSLYKLTMDRYSERYPNHDIRLSVAKSDCGKQTGWRARLVDKTEEYSRG